MLVENPEKTESNLVQLFKLKKSQLGFHDGSITNSRHYACPDPVEHETLSEILAVVTKSKKSENLCFGKNQTEVLAN